MKILYLDLVGGISGDMTVAALLDLGVPLEPLREALQGVGLEGVELTLERAQRHQISGTRFIVRDAAGEAAHGHGHVHLHRPHEPEEPHGRGPEHGHEQEHEHAHDQGAGERHGHPHRDYRDIRHMIERGRLPAGARRRALAVFARLAEAEGRVHGVDPEAVTFHEVGAWDSIADVVCAAVALEHLGPDLVYCSPVPLGTGTVWTAHGRMPVPAPATLLLLEGFPVVHGGPAFERTTPTGAAILAALAEPAPEPVAYVPRQVGVGIGTKDAPEVPNILRAVLGDVRAPEGPVERVEVAEANLDDASPEWIGYLMERLFEAGALDVLLIPVHMKKNRPGTLVQVLYPPGLRETILHLFFSEATTLGVRYAPWERVVLPREPASVETAYGTVTGKLARHQGHARFAPEHEACRALARRHNVPLQTVYQAALLAWHQRSGGEG